MIVYKCVRPLGGGVYASAVVKNSRYRLLYVPGVETLPPEWAPEAWPLAFKSYEDARAFRNGGYDRGVFEIWEAEAPKVNRVDYVLFQDDKRYFRLFWAGKSGTRQLVTIAPPYGTVACSSITLLEEL